MNWYCNAKSKRMSKRRQKIYVVRCLHKRIEQAMLAAIKQSPLGFNEDGYGTLKLRVDGELARYVIKEVAFGTGVSL